MPVKIIEPSGGVVFMVRVIPCGSRSELVGEYDGLLKVKVSAAPADGAANAELIRLFSRHFGVSKSDIHIVWGETSRNKRIKIDNLSLSKFEELTRRKIKFRS